MERRLSSVSATSNTEQSVTHYWLFNEKATTPPKRVNLSRGRDTKPQALWGGWVAGETQTLGGV